MTTITIRSARADDAAAAAPLVHLSGPAAFDYVFARDGWRAEDFLRRAWRDGGGEFGHRSHVVAEIDGEIVGVGAGYGSAPLAFMLAAAGQIVSHYGPVQASGVIVRGLRVEQVIPPPPAGEALYLAHLAVAPGLRSKGVGRRIIDHLLEAGASKGRRRVALDVSTANPRAQALYERLGFAVVKEYASRLAAAPAHRRMERAL